MSTINIQKIFNKIFDSFERKDYDEDKNEIYTHETAIQFVIRLDELLNESQIFTIKSTLRTFGFVVDNIKQERNHGENNYIIIVDITQNPFDKMKIRKFIIILLTIFFIILNLMVLFRFDMYFKYIKK